MNNWCRAELSHFEKKCRSITESAIFSRFFPSDLKTNWRQQFWLYRWKLVNWQYLFIFGIIVFGESIIAETLSDSFSYPQERRSLTLRGRCDFVYNGGTEGNVPGTSGTRFHGRIIHLEMNSVGEIIISGCPESTNEVQCSNVFRGNVLELCRAEINSRRVRAVARGGVDAFTTVAGFPFSLVSLPRGLSTGISVANSQFLSGSTRSNFLPENARNGTYQLDRQSRTSTSQRVAEYVVPGMAASREFREADCSLTKNIVEVINHNDSRTFDSGSSKENKQITEGQGHSCQTRDAMAILSSLRPEEELNRIRNSPTFHISTEQGHARVSTNASGSWYQNFLRNQEDYESDRRQRAAPVQTVPRGPTPIIRRGRN